MKDKNYKEIKLMKNKNDINKNYKEIKMIKIKTIWIKIENKIDEK